MRDWYGRGVHNNLRSSSVLDSTHAGRVCRACAPAVDPEDWAHGVGARFSQCDPTWTLRCGAAERGAAGATAAGNDAGTRAAYGPLARLLSPELPVAIVYSLRLAHQEASRANPA